MFERNLGRCPDPADTWAVFTSLAEMARTPVSKVDDFCAAFEEWVRFVGATIPGSPTRRVADVLDEVFYAAEALGQKLHELKRYLEIRVPEAAPDGELELAEWAHHEAGVLLEEGIKSTAPGAISIAGLHLAVSVVAAEARKAKEDLRGRPRPQQPGAPPGSRKFPMADALVAYLETVAQSAGGKFTINKKIKGGKGTIIQAMDLLRKLCIANPKLKFLAEYLPPAGQHPLATYERTMDAIRKLAKEVRAGQQTNVRE
jgi:hypothetical protein